MRLIRQGDRVQVHYTKSFQDGSVVSSRGKSPTEVTVGVDHPRLPGLGLALVGLAEGESRTLVVPAEGAYGPSDPGRIHRLACARFAGHEGLSVGMWVRIQDRRQRRRLVRVVEIQEHMVVVDSNRRWAGQALELEVRVVAIRSPEVHPGADRGTAEPVPDQERDLREASWLDDGAQA
jgi:peptidylprolyl isomerase